METTTTSCNAAEREYAMDDKQNNTNMLEVANSIFNATASTEGDDSTPVDMTMGLYLVELCHLESCADDFPDEVQVSVNSNKVVKTTGPLRYRCSADALFELYANMYTNEFVVKIQEYDVKTIQHAATVRKLQCRGPLGHSYEECERVL